MKIGEIFEMLRKFQQGEHHGDYDHHKKGHYGGHGHDNHHEHEYHDKYKDDHHDGHQSQYESQHNSQMGLCSKCGMAISSEHKFCPKCGVECKTYFECKSCHAKTRPGDTFCSHCGCKI